MASLAIPALQGRLSRSAPGLPSVPPSLQEERRPRASGLEQSLRLWEGISLALALTPQFKKTIQKFLCEDGSGKRAAFNSLHQSGVGQSLHVFG